MKQKKKEKENGTKTTPIGFEKHEWKIIGGKKAWKRICPVCNEDVWHHERAYVYRKKYKSTMCRECWKKQKTNILIRNCPDCKKELNYKTYKYFWYANKNDSKCRSCAKKGNLSRRGMSNSDIHRKRLSASLKGRKISEKGKQNMRIAAIKRLKNKCGHPYANYNPDACKFMDRLNEEKNWNLRHALNGGECYLGKLGYWLDAYDKKLNIVVEYDEPRHEKPSIKKKDIIRQNNIINHLNCKFYRYSEKCDNLYEVKNPTMKQQPIGEEALNIVNKELDKQ